MNDLSPKLHAAALILAARLNHTPKHILYRQLYKLAIQQKHAGHELDYHTIIRLIWHIKS